MRSLGLTIHPLEALTKKTSIFQPGGPFEFLGLEFNQHSLRPIKKKWDKLRVQMKVATNVKLAPTLPELVRGHYKRRRATFRLYRNAGLNSHGL